MIRRAHIKYYTTLKLMFAGFKTLTGIFPPVFVCVLGFDAVI